MITADTIRQALQCAPPAAEQPSQSVLGRETFLALDQKSTIMATLAFLHPDAAIFELCVIAPKPPKSPAWEGFAGGKKAIVAGWFQDHDKAAQLAAYVWATGVYITLNPTNKALLSRANERLVAGVGRTKDTEISHIRNLLIDIDPIRPEGISSTDAEHEAALEMVQIIRSDLENQAWPDPLIGDSGNGAHLVYPLDLLPGEENTALLEGVLAGLARRYADQLALRKIELDQVVFNAARLTKLYGTWARKGDNTTERPHRLAKILYLPEARHPVPIDLLQKIAGEAELKDAPKTPPHGQTIGQFDLAAYLLRYNVEVLRVKPHGGGQLYCLQTCVFDASHEGNEAAIRQAADGKLFYQCFHTSCKGRTWKEARQIISGTDSLVQFSGLPDRKAPPSTAGLSQVSQVSQGGVSGGNLVDPDPLRRKPEPAEPYPVEALGEILGMAATVDHSIIKAPLAICAQSVLAAANLAVQGHADVVIDGRRFPVSEYFLSIAQSGERKSAADAAALAPVDAHQRYLLDAYSHDTAQYALEAALWKKEYDDALRKKDPQARRAALESLPPAPTGPPYPQLTTEEPTYEGLVKLLAVGWPTVGLFSSEGGRFFGGFAMNLENRLKTLAGLSDLWDGRPLTRTRAGDGSVTLYGRRCCAHLLMQPLVAENILGDPLAHDQGFLSRCLIIAPESALGSQAYVSQDLNQQADYGRYCARITTILQVPLPFKPDPETGKPTNELVTKQLQISPDAKRDWIDFHDWIQENLRPDGPYLPISGIAAKAAEHALRLAGTLTLVENLEATVISQENVRSGITLANFYLTEALRLFHSAKTNLDLINAEKVLAWLRTRSGVDKSLICLPDVYRLGPNVVRDKETAVKIMTILADHGWINQLASGAKIDGKQRRQVWMVHPHVFETPKI